MAGYFKNIAEGVKSTLTGMGLTFRHARDARNRRKANNIQLNDFFEVRTGMVTVQYPQETVPIPDNGRYRLHNEIDDCIVCDKCAKVCPVDCIEIEPIKATEEVGRASDGSVIRLYAAKFDIDMAKCCYCGLCTTVCPTECLTMTKTFDYSEFDVREMVYAYSNLTPEEAQEKRELLEQFQLEKAQGKSRAATPAEAPGAAVKPAFRPVMKPKATAAPVGDVKKEKEKPTKSAMPFHPRNWTPDTGNFERLYFAYGKQQPLKRPADTSDAIQSAIKAASGAGFRPTIKPKSTTSSPGAAATAKPAFRPTMKPKGTDAAEPGNKAEAPKPAFRPTMKPKGTDAAEPGNKAEAPKPAFRPTMKPKGADTTKPENKAEAPKPAFRPTMKPKGTDAAEPGNKAEAPKPAFRPTMKPKGTDAAEPGNKTEAPKPAFRPTMKPKGTDAAEPGNKTEAPKPAFRPTMKPKGTDAAEPENKTEAPKPAFRPTMKPKGTDAAEPGNKTEAPKPAFRPTMKPKGTDAAEPENKTEAPKPAFRPTMKPKGTDAAEPENKTEVPQPAFTPTVDFSSSLSENRPAFKPQHIAVPANNRFSPAGYRVLKSAARPSFDVKLPAAFGTPEQQPADQAASPPPDTPAASAQPAAARPKGAFRPTMKPKK